MAIPPPSEDFDTQRGYFRRLRGLLDELIADGLEVDTLSMGMTADLGLFSAVQFFATASVQPFLTGQHPCFGMVVQGRDVIERLGIAVDAALKRDEPLGHVLFDGPPGLGKTTLALCIPREMDVNVLTTTAAALKKPGDLVPYLSNLEEGAVLFIDEIHRLPHAVEEYLYPAMEDFRIDIILGEGVNARTISMQLKPFTLIGATTRAGMLTAPLRDRFQIREHLDF